MRQNTAVAARKLAKFTQPDLLLLSANYRLSKQRVNKRRSSGTGKEGKQRQYGNNQQDGRQPPFLVRAEKIHKLPHEGRSSVLGSGFERRLLFALWILHRSEERRVGKE